MKLTDIDINEIDKIFLNYFEERRSPGLVYGITYNSDLVHTKSLGLRSIEGKFVDVDTSFRVASLTKSFTAAAALILRDRKLLNLDLPISEYVPEMEKVVCPYPDAPSLTVRQLLSMSAGFPTDNEWADRLESIEDNELIQIISNGLRFDFIPGTSYEYSNLGYAIIALAIKNIAGKSFINFVTDEILKPLKLNTTTFDYAKSENFAFGYVKRENWEVENLTGPGAFSSIGGITTNLSDLASWIAYLSSAFNDEVEDFGPICKPSRREMQKVQQVITQIREPNVELSYSGVNGYGFGLRIEEDLELGKFVGHSGGYPGYGAHMRWHPETGWGVIAMANGRYAAPSLPCIPSLRYLVTQTKQTAKQVPSNLLFFQEQVNKLIDNWQDSIADNIFGFNIDLDHPRDFQRKQIEVAKKHVDYNSSQIEMINTKFISNSNLTWQLKTSKGVLDVTIFLNPDLPEKLQVLRILPVSLLNS